MKTKNRCRARATKSLVSILCLIFILSTTNAAFAMQGEVNEQNEVNKITTQIDDLVGNDKTLETVYEGKNDYIPETTNTEVSIPKEGCNKVSLSVGDNDISMSLPDEVKECEGVLTKEGYVVYDSKSDVNVIVQAMEEALNSEEIRNTVRTVISIENNDAPKEYSFNYDLPDGYRLMMGSELGNNEIPNDAVGIINEEGYAVAIIDSPWAKDASGKDLQTAYRIEGNQLIQTVDFDEEAKFPIIADPSTIVDSRTKSTTYQKKTGWEIVGGQPSDGYIFRTGGSVGWYYGVGTSKSMSFTAELTTKTLTVTYKLGIAKISSSGHVVSVTFPASTKAKKIIAKHKLNITEKREDYKYRNTKITNNGKNKEVTYQWVTVRNWVDKVTEATPEFDLKVV